MTIICIKDGTIAADGAVFCGHHQVASNVRKIARSPDGALAACAGPGSVCAMFRNLFLNMPAEMRAPGNLMVADLKQYLHDENFQAIWLEPNGEVRRMCENGVVSGCGETTAAVGSAEDFALGALRAGASAEEAARLCIEHTVYAAGEVQVERLASVEEVEIEGPAELVEHFEGEPEGAGESGFLGWGQAVAEPPKPDWKEEQGLK